MKRDPTPASLRGKAGNALASRSRKVAVIGGGWAGCAAAVELASNGHQPLLFEASRSLGGRARGVQIDGKPLDNGQHILLGAYAETLRLMRTVGIDPSVALLRLPLQMRYPDTTSGMRFVTPRLPAPLHLLGGLLLADGLDWDDKISLARFSTTARWMGWQLHQDCTVAELLDRFDQTDRLIKLMWRPLCIAALNTPPEQASAQVFLAVLRDSLGARRAASDMLIPRVDLSALFPTRAASYIEDRGGKVSLGAAVRRIDRQGELWKIDAGNGELPFDADAVIVAVQPDKAAMLLSEIIDTGRLAGLQYEPITTCYLQYDSAVRLPVPFYALVDSSDAGEWGQFVFDRGHLDPHQAGLLSVVVSASADAIESGHEALTAAISGQLARVLKRPELARPAWTKVISEKRATFSCTPALQRPQVRTGLPGLALAGDYVEGEYPATLESAIRGGIQAARAVVAPGDD
ncbi:hydroxysqualene dehydroxylase HpnE [Noviherbaspirillum sp.]|uniref:hydroxysqualene dehydroxylase HpnE n=1 Tax=Noviherbaspirillum sp. TaxID=1926288 RepID=UPI002FE4184E